MTINTSSARSHDRGRLVRSRWAAIGAAVAVSICGGAAVRFADAAPGPTIKSEFVSITPVRVLDTRPAPDNVGGFIGPVGAGVTHTITVAGVAGVPGDATAVVVNITAVAPSANTFVAVWPAGESRPSASNLNPRSGVVVANLATVKVGDDGKINLFNNSGTVHLVVDVQGYFAPANTKFINIPVMSAASSNEFDDVYAEPTFGIGFAGTGASGDTAAWNFVLPPDYTTGTPITATFYWRINSKGCSVAWAADYAYVNRPGRVAFADQSETGDAASGMDGPSLTAAPATLKQVVATSITLTSPEVDVPLQAGDSYTFSIFRNTLDPDDTCLGYAFVDAVYVRYQ